MSLEAAIERNTAAIEKLIAALTTAPAANQVPEEILAATEPDPPKTKRSKKEAKPEASAGEPEQSAPSPETGAAGAQETAGAAPATKELSYQDAADAVTALINANGRAAAVALLKRFGAANLKQVDPSQYAALIAAARDEAVPF